jgi:hypothetical protein
MGGGNTTLKPNSFPGSAASTTQEVRHQNHPRRFHEENRAPTTGPGELRRQTADRFSGLKRP